MNCSFGLAHNYFLNGETVAGEDNATAMAVDWRYLNLDEMVENIVTHGVSGKDNNQLMQPEHVQVEPLRTDASNVKLLVSASAACVP